MTDLQLAISVAAPGAQVWVAQGTYKPKQKNVAFELRSGIELYGGFVGTETLVTERDPEIYPTILSGDLNADDTPEAFVAGMKVTDNSHHVVTASGVDETSVLDGFRIQGAVGEGLQSLCGGKGGGGIRLISSRPRIRNCVIGMNVGPSGGGCSVVGGSDAVFEDCLFSDNFSIFDGGGAIAICDSSPVINRCSFVANKATLSGVGGAVLVSGDSQPAISEGQFIDNSAGGLGGALCLLSKSAPIIDRCVFVKNAAVSGGAVALSANEALLAARLVVRSSGFHKNSASSGGAISSYNCSLELAHCTIASNESVGLGAGVILLGLSVDVEIWNCVLWGNDSSGETDLDAQLWSSLSSEIPLPITYSCVQGWVEDGSGNSNEDPRFVDLNGQDGIAGTLDDNFDVLPSSPCVDGGTSLPPVVDLSLNGFSRSLDGNLDGVMLPDMGASEHSNVRLEVEQLSARSVSIAVQSNAPLWGYLVVGLSSGSVQVDPFGSLLMNPTKGIARTFVGSLPYEASLAVPIGTNLPRSVRVQALGLKPGADVGNLSNAVWISLGN